MPKGYRPYLPDQDLLLPPRCAGGLGRMAAAAIGALTRVSAVVFALLAVSRRGNSAGLLAVIEGDLSGPARSRTHPIARDAILSA